MLPILSGLLSPFGTAIPFEPFEFSRPLIDDARVMSVVSAPDAAAATAVVAASVPPTPVTAVDANVAVKLGGIPLHRLPETFRFFRAFYKFSIPTSEFGVSVRNGLSGICTIWEGY